MGPISDVELPVRVFEMLVHSSAADPEFAANAQLSESVGSGGQDRRFAGRQAEGSELLAAADGSLIERDQRLAVELGSAQQFDGERAVCALEPQGARGRAGDQAPGARATSR